VFSTTGAGNAGIERDLPPVNPGDGQSQWPAARDLLEGTRATDYQWTGDIRGC
jgi:hypothetical protein